MDSKPFITAEWNDGLTQYINRVYVSSKGKPFTTYNLTSPLEPGTDGRCVAILYIREQKPSWKMFPCRLPISPFWICKKHVKTHNAIPKKDYPSHRCVRRCLLINNTCYHYKFVPTLKNNTMTFDTDKFNLLYLTQNLANHGVHVKLMGGHIVRKIAAESVKSTIQDNRTTASRLSDRKVLLLEKSDISVRMCGPTMQHCDDGSCKVQSNICILDFICAPRLCACMVGNQLNHNLNYCRSQCPPGICVCASFMFQCSIGGCIPYSHVCDNENDCADSSDEFCSTEKIRKYFIANTPSAFRNHSTKSSPWCLDFLCPSGQCIDVQLVNDLIPDCTDADDESHSLSMKYQGMHFRCNHTQAIPCVYGHSKCFAVENLCVYDRDDLGHINHCRDGSHLRNCRYMECTNTFKCPESYCIPIRKVCDDIHDCPNGEDEISCQNNICPGYLKCSEVQYCIHPVDVCDGYSHCPQGDDEKLCDIGGCPNGCLCLGRGVVCREERFSYIPAFPFLEMIYLSVGSNYMHFPEFSNLSSLSQLVILDLSSAMVIDICPALQEDYTFYHSLHLLYLQHNNMNHISSVCFAKLPSLLVINLQGNPLLDIADDAFKDISLNVLILSKAPLSSLSGKLIRGFRSLKTLDKRGVKLSYLSQSLVDGLRELETVFSDDTRLCCLLKNANNCENQNAASRRCFRLLSHSSVAPILTVLVITIIFFITLSLWFAAKLHANSRPVQWLLYNTVLINKSLCVFYCLAIAIIDKFHGKYYIFWYTSEYNQLLYQGLSITFSNGMIMSNIAASLLDHIACKAVSRSLLIERNATLNIKIILFSLHFLVITGYTVFTILLEDEINHRFLTNYMWGAPLGVPFNDYKWFATGPLFLSLIIFLTLTYSVLTYIAIYRHTYVSGKRVQTIAATGIDMHQIRLYELLKTLSRSAMYRSLECLPIIFIILVKVWGTDIGLEFQLMSIMMSVTFGCIGTTLKSVWYPMFNQRHTWVAFLVDDYISGSWYSTEVISLLLALFIMSVGELTY